MPPSDVRMHSLPKGRMLRTWRRTTANRESEAFPIFKMEALWKLFTYGAPGNLDKQLQSSPTVLLTCLMEQFPLNSYYMYVHRQVPWNSRIIHYLPFRCWCWCWRRVQDYEQKEMEQEQGWEEGRKERKKRDCQEGRGGTKNKKSSLVLSRRNCMSLGRRNGSWAKSTHTVLAEDLSSVPSIHVGWLTTDYNSSSRKSDTYVWLPPVLTLPCRFWP